MSQALSKVSEKRRTAEKSGRWAEYFAAACLMLRGYRVIARRHRTPYGELDLIAARGRRIAFIEVKCRPDRETAQASLGSRQARRMHRAATYWLANNPAYQAHDIGFDAMFVLPGRWPQFLPDQMQPTG